MRKRTCKDCPVEQKTEAAQMSIDVGCLPHLYDMTKWHRETGKLWACHSNCRKPCGGLINYLEDSKIEYSNDSSLITEDMTLEEIYS